MPNRAERRRTVRDNAKKENYYYYTKSQIEGMVRQETRKQANEMKKKAANEVMSLLLVLPMVTLIDDYGVSDPDKLEEFMNYVLEYYEKWDDGVLDLENLREYVFEKTGIKLIANAEVDS